MLWPNVMRSIYLTKEYVNMHCDCCCCCCLCFLVGMKLRIRPAAAGDFVDFCSFCEWLGAGGDDDDGGARLVFVWCLLLFENKFELFRENN